MSCRELLIIRRLKKQAFVLEIMPGCAQPCQIAQEVKAGEKVSCLAQLAKGGLRPDGPHLSPWPNSTSDSLSAGV